MQLNSVSPSTNKTYAISTAGLVNVQPIPQKTRAINKTMNELWALTIQSPDNANIHKPNFFQNKDVTDLLDKILLIEVVNLALYPLHGSYFLYGSLFCIITCIGICKLLHTGGVYDFCRRRPKKAALINDSTIIVNNSGIHGLFWKASSRELTIRFDSLIFLRIFASKLLKYNHCRFKENLCTFEIVIPITEKSYLSKSQTKKLIDSYTSFLLKIIRNNCQPMEIKRISLPQQPEKSENTNLINVVKNQDHEKEKGGYKKEKKHHGTENFKSSKYQPSIKKVPDVSCSIFPLERASNYWKNQCQFLIDHDPEKDTEFDSPEEARRSLSTIIEEKKEIAGERKNERRIGKFLPLKHPKKAIEVPFTLSTKSLSNQEKGYLKRRLITAVHALSASDAIVEEILKNGLIFNEDTLLKKIYQYALEYQSLRFTEAIYPTGYEKNIERDQQFFDYLEEHFFSIEKLQEIRNKLRTPFVKISFDVLLDLCKRFYEHQTCIHLKNFIQLKGNNSDFIPLKLEDISIVSMDASPELGTLQEIAKCDIKLLSLIKMEILFITDCIKPFRDSQFGNFYLASGIYLDAIKKSLSNISKYYPMLSLEVKCFPSFLKSKEMFSIIQWGNKVAHHIEEEIEIAIAVDEVPLGKIWDYFNEESPILEDLKHNIDLARMELTLVKRE